MAVLEIPDQGIIIREPAAIKSWLANRGVLYEQWEAAVEFGPDANQDIILGAYAHVLQPYMQANGYQVADVINITPQMPNLDAVRQKFLEEHIHTEDEVRFFVEGKGYFWFNLGGNEPVFAVLCEVGDLISVPAGSAHWFDMGANPNVKVIRVFIDPAGWVPEYTGSSVAKTYNKAYNTVL